MAGKYYVDDSDPGFVTIHHIDDWDHDCTPTEGMTLAQAKAEVIEHYQHQLKHARALIRHTRQIRAADFVKD